MNTYDGQKAHEHMLNIINYQRNASQNYNEVSQISRVIIKICTNGKFWRVYGEKGTLLHRGWECKLITATRENSMEVP